MTKENKLLDDLFDDVVQEGNSFWSQLCNSCANKYGHLGCLDEIPVRTICGIKGCEYQAEYYFDMYEFLPDKS